MKKTEKNVTKKAEKENNSNRLDRFVDTSSALGSVFAHMQYTRVPFAA